MAMTAPGRRLAQRRDERRRRIVGLGAEAPAGDPRALLEGAQDLRFLLRAHALELRAGGPRVRPASSSSSVRIPSW